MQRIGAVCTVRAVLRLFLFDDETVFIVIITVLATLVVGGITLAGYLWYLMPGSEQIK
jgi:hypothetical protein